MWQYFSREFIQWKCHVVLEILMDSCLAGLTWRRSFIPAGSFVLARSRCARVWVGTALSQRQPWRELNRCKQNALSRWELQKENWCNEEFSVSYPTTRLLQFVSAVLVRGGGMVQGLQWGRAPNWDARAGAGHSPPPEPLRAGHTGLRWGKKHPKKKTQTAATISAVFENI